MHGGGGGGDGGGGGVTPTTPFPPLELSHVKLWANGNRGGGGGTNTAHHSAHRTSSSENHLYTGQDALCTAHMGASGTHATALAAPSTNERRDKIKHHVGI